MLYTLLVSNSDDFGRLAGDPFTVKHAVYPTSPRREQEFADALVALHEAGLIQLYATPEDAIVVQIQKFAEHQPGLSKKTRSKFPDPPVNFTEIPAQLKRREEKGREEEQIHVRSPNESGTAGEDERRKDENREIAAFIAKFCEVYAKYRHGARYFIKREKHVPLIRALLKTYGFERLVKLSMLLLKTDDDWVLHTDRGIEILSVKASWLDIRLSEYEAANGPIKVTA